jgi:hypothetical protein
MQKATLFKESLFRYVVVKGALLSASLFGIVGGLAFGILIVQCNLDNTCPGEVDPSQDYMLVILMITVVIVGIILIYSLVLPKKRFLILENEIRLPSSRLPILPTARGVVKASRAVLEADDIARVQLEIGSGTEYGGLPTPWKCTFFLEDGYAYVLNSGEIPGNTDECLEKIKEFMRLNDIRFVVVRKGLP